jgi:hypothetical protein
MQINTAVLNAMDEAMFLSIGKWHKKERGMQLINIPNTCGWSAR